MNERPYIKHWMEMITKDRGVYLERRSGGGWWLKSNAGNELLLFRTEREVLAFIDGWKLAAGYGI